MLRKLVHRLQQQKTKHLSYNQLNNLLSTSDLEILFGTDTKPIISETEFTELAENSTIHPSLRDYVIGLARICARHESKDLEKTVSRYFIAAKELEKDNGSFYLPAFFYTKANDSAFNPPASQLALEGLIRLASRGDKDAMFFLRDYLHNKIKLNTATQFELDLFPKVLILHAACGVDFSKNRGAHLALAIHYSSEDRFSEALHHFEEIYDIAPINDPIMQAAKSYLKNLQ